MSGTDGMTFESMAWAPSKKAIEKEHKIEMKLTSYNRKIGTMPDGDIVKFVLARRWELHKGALLLIGITVLLTSLLWVTIVFYLAGNKA